MPYYANSASELLQSRSSFMILDPNLMKKINVEYYKHYINSATWRWTAMDKDFNKNLLAMFIRYQMDHFVMDLSQINHPRPCHHFQQQRLEHANTTTLPNVEATSTTIW